MASLSVPRARPENFDTLIGSVIVMLIILIGGVVLLGDQAGVGVSLTDPTTDQPIPSAGDVRTMPALPQTVSLTLRFAELMAPDSVRVQITPATPGISSWNGVQWVFTPATALIGDTHYTLTLQDGARALSGRAVRGEHRWAFRVRQPTILFLYPALHAKRSEQTNLYRVQPPGKPEKLTETVFGVEDYAPSPNGSQVVFTQKDADGKTDLYLLELQSRAVQRLTNCVRASCRAPFWNPDGNRIVYERAESTTTDAETRAWIVDIRTLTTEPLFIEQRWLGKTPRWSHDGRTITLFDRELGGIALIDVVSGARSIIQTLEDDSGQFSVDSTRLAYTQLTTAPQGIMRQTEIADFRAQPRTVHPLTPPDGALTDDRDAVWHPDGTKLAIMRRYLGDERASEKFQVYEVDAMTGVTKPLVVDPQYAHGALSWRADGAQLLMQRFPYLEPNAEPGIWVFDVRSQTITQVAQNGFLPRWIP